MSIKKICKPDFLLNAGFNGDGQSWSVVSSEFVPFSGSSDKWFSSSGWVCFVSSAGFMTAISLPFSVGFESIALEPQKEYSLSSKTRRTLHKLLPKQKINKVKFKYLTSLKCTRNAQKHQMITQGTLMGIKLLCREHIGAKYITHWPNSSIA